MKIKNGRRLTSAVKVVILFGVISLLGDMVYESARGANSQYFNLLSITAAQVGLVFGIGEFLGYFLRLLAGVLSDKSGKHWIFIFIGYGMLIVVPFMGFTMNWNILVTLILMERIGKSLRNPAKDTVLSAIAENQVGIGFAFGLQEALDQIGALSGPLIFTLVFFLTGKNGIAEYQFSYKLLFIPFVFLMLFVVHAYRSIKKNNLITDIKKKESCSDRLEPIFWIYTVFTFFCTLGFVNFSVIGYHLKANNLMTDGNITLLYSGAMAVDAVAALLVGKAYDRMKRKKEMKAGGLAVLAAIPFITLLLPFMTISSSITLIVIGMIIFGIVLGTHETIMRSAIADITPFHKRGTSYGVFNAAYGLALLIGSASMGWLYDLNQSGIIIAFTCAAEVVAILLYFRMVHSLKARERQKS